MLRAIFPFLFLWSLQAQDFKAPMRSTPSIYFELAQLIGTNRFFSADMVGANPNSSATSPIKSQIAIAHGMFRLENKASAMGDSFITDERLSFVKRIGMDRQVYVLKVDEGLFYFIYPDANLHHVEEFPKGKLQSTRDEANADQFTTTLVATNAKNINSSLGLRTGLMTK